MQKQHTLAGPASLAGVSLHTGEKVTLTIRPAPVNHGFKFRRTDLKDQPTVDALATNVRTVERATTLVEGNVKVHTVEHILSALTGLGVDNALIEMDANEPPIGDGSAAPYVALIKKAGIEEQDAPRRYCEIREPVAVDTKNGSILVILPDTKFRVSCTQAGPNGTFTQYLSLEITPETYEKEIAPARTFVHYEDVEPLMEKGLIRGGSLENAIVIRDNSVLSKEPLRFEDEFVRHKILDIVGDLTLLGPPLLGHLVALRPRHGPHTQL
ncbi:MAG: UDP-3-O-acyl-N-acetylglucosamine deacetylase, partial [Chthoniobacterales bacterium]